MDTHSIELLKKWQRKKPEGADLRDYWLSTSSNNLRSARFCVRMSWRAGDSYPDVEEYGSTAPIAVKRALAKAASMGAE